MRQRLCKVCRGWHDLDEEWPLGCYIAQGWKRAMFPTPMVNGDGMSDTQSMLDGKYYDSKSELRRTYKAAGVIEVGNDGPMTPPPPKRGDPKAREAAAVMALKKAGLWDALPD